MRNILIYTIHKAASMFIHKLSVDVSHEFEIPYYSVNLKKYNNSIKQSSWKQFIEDESKQGCFGPIRAGEAEPIVPSNFDCYSIILHLRDPRDVLTSLFFSHTYSHGRRAEGFNPSNEQRKQWEDSGVDDFIFDKILAFKKRYQYLTSTLLGKRNVIFIKYENMISDYSAWLKCFLSAFSHLKVPQKRALRYLKTHNSQSQIHKRLYKRYKNEFIPPSKDRIFKHKRQITPGDYKRKLKPETIEKLNFEFSDILKLLDYE